MHAVVGVCVCMVVLVACASGAAMVHLSRMHGSDEASITATWVTQRALSVQRAVVTL